LVVLASANAIDNGDDESYLNLEFFLPGASTVDIIITTRYARVGEIEATEVVELFQKCARLQFPRPDLDTEVLQIVAACTGDDVGGIACRRDPTAKVGTSAHIRLEYRERRKQLC
jgi:hypothetical protein